MRKDKYKVQVGDVLYQASKSYKKGFAWKVIAIWLEDYISGRKTVLSCSNGTWAEEFFASDVRGWFDDREAAVAVLEEMLNE